MAVRHHQLLVQRPASGLALWCQTTLVNPSASVPGSSFVYPQLQNNPYVSGSSHIHHIASTSPTQDLSESARLSAAPSDQATALLSTSQRSLPVLKLGRGHEAIETTANLDFAVGRSIP